MRKLGHFSHRSASGRLIVKMCDQVKPPKFGTKVFTSKGDAVGLLVDVIGSTKNPYAVLKPLAANIKLEPLEVVYVRGSP
ncbi:MAG: Gar1/Naf1 family protein [Sulfolobales archaeon]